MPKSVSLEISEGRTLTIETGRLAQQANGSVLVTLGDTQVLVTAVMSRKAREGTDFFPLTCDFEERMYAAGKIPGGFPKREGRPSEKAILTSRLMDRPLRPLFPDGMRNDVQCIAIPLSVDMINLPDTLAVLGASAALHISDIPWHGPIGCVRVGLVDGQYIAHPTQELLDKSELDVVVAGTRDSVVMVEAGASEVTESEVAEAIEFGHREIQRLCDLQEELQRQAGVEKSEPIISKLDPELLEAVRQNAAEELRAAVQDPDKASRENAISELSEAIVARMAPDYPERERELAAACDKLVKQEVRRLVLDEGKRPDGRRVDEIRPLSVEAGLVKRAHGSGLFTRGQTQVLTACTLGSLDEEQILDTISVETSKRYIHHYNFPPFSVGEARPLRGAGRRDIGHGALAERALKGMIPPTEEFPYVIRLVSDVLESNGSSSMASVCGSTIALMDAGVKLKAPVAGIAMGLMTEGDRYCILTDIQGMEDFGGDMDFKVAGTRTGITAIQMDTKLRGISFSIVRDALEQARRARLQILDAIQAVIPEPRESLSPYAPRIYILQINPDKIGEVIGPGGKVIKKIQAETGAKIDIEQDGTVYVACVDAAGGERARDWIRTLTKEVQVGEVYTGKVVRLMNFGAFVELVPGKDGLVHVSKLARGRVERPEDVVKIGDELKVRVAEIDGQGRINLVREDLPEAPAHQGRGGHERNNAEGQVGTAYREAREREGRGGGGGGGRGRGRGGDRGGRGGDRGGDRSGDRSGDRDSRFERLDAPVGVSFRPKGPQGSGNEG